uniref:Putative secretory protein n=1 Tax=Pelinobius muticus TaxID=753628 RepID=D5J6Z5_PELMU|nr:putative secretory protein [Pelinobius muticus]
MRNMFKYWPAIVFSLVVAVNSNDECDPRQLDSCLSNGELTIEGLEQLPGEEFFNERCGPDIEALKCVKSVVERCPEHNELNARIETIESVINFLNDICNESSTVRKGYLENVECYNNALPNIFTCVINGATILRNFALSLRNKTGDVRDIRPVLCLSPVLITSCLIKESTELRGSENTAPLVIISTDLTSIAKEILCPDEDVFRELGDQFAEYLDGNNLELMKGGKWESVRIPDSWSII